MPKPDYAIELRHITKTFPLSRGLKEFLQHPWHHRNTTILDNLSLAIPRGELHSLLGKNGAGKTTLLKLLANVLLPDAGEILIQSQNAAPNDPNFRRHIGYVLAEERSFYWRLTGRQNLVFFAQLNNLFGRLAREKIEFLAALTGISPALDTMFKDYSTGMKQKLAIARGLLSDPDILLMDEPTRSLDPVDAEKLRTFIRNILVGQERKTILLATHNLDEAKRISQGIALLQKGRIAFHGNPEEAGPDLTSLFHRFDMPAEDLDGAI
jgi:ABC-2 type transport system ATP-binding protein